MEITPGTSRIKEEPSDDQKTRHDISLVKLEALNQGKFTDCVFLVGSADGKKEEVHAVKSVMMMASSLMEGLFTKRPYFPSGPIRIKDVDPKIFKIIVEFVLLGQLKTEVNCEALLELLIAADRYLIESLKILCVNMLKREITVSAVWLTLQKLLKIDHLKSEADICIPLLTKKTKECLEHKMFLTATSDSVSFLLQQDTLDLKSENELVNYCVKWAQNQKCPRKSFRSVYEQLRLLQLTPKQVEDLPQNFLTQIETLAIFKSMKLDAPNLPSNLCSNIAPRKFQPSLKRKHDSGEHKEYPLLLIGKEMVAKSSQDLKRNEKYSTNDTSFTNTMIITPKENIYFTRFFILGQIQDLPTIIFDKKLSRYVTKPSQKEYKISVVIARNGENICTYTWEKALFDKNPGMHLYTACLLPKGETTKLEFKFSIGSPSTFRNILLNDVNACIQKNLDSDLFESFHMEVSDKEPIIINRILYIAKK